MQIKQITLKNFRNFIDETIKLSENNIIVGCNDSGKSNLLYAIRLLLDRDLPEPNLTPTITDFNATTKSYRYDIIIEFCDIFEECIHAKLKGHISDDNRLLLKLVGGYVENTGSFTHSIYIGFDADNLQEIEYRYYLKVLHVKYIESMRDIEKYVRKEKKVLLSTSQESREDLEVLEDENISKIITRLLEMINKKIPTLNYIKKATDSVNETLKLLSAQNYSKDLLLKTRDTDPRFLLERLVLGVDEHGIPLPLGGDGFINQAHLALWALRQKNEKLDTDREEVRIFCIEEVEAHLHPHQQRRLSKFMIEHFQGSQLLLTTHSPQIACNFDVKSIIRLIKKNGLTEIMTEEANNLLYKGKVDFGYRMDAISAEVYYSDVIVLVEGPSELLFYKAVAKASGFDLDKYNISIISVDGVGFMPYIDIAYTFGTNCICRTDNDIMKIPNKDEYRYAGIERGCSIVEVFDDEDLCKSYPDLCSLLRWKGKATDFSLENTKAQVAIAEELEKYNVFIADVDLETDLLNTSLQEEIIAFFGCDTVDEAIKELQKKKATNMFDLLEKIFDKLDTIKNEKITAPLRRAIELAEEQWQ